ncbi:MAG: PEP-CTERM sorting domain-containing protein, partial [Pirellulales bacterium]
STFRDASPPPATIVDDSTATGTDLGVFSIILRQSPAPFLTLDELRVGTTWRDVTIPEPTTFALLALSAVGLLPRRFRWA